MTKVVVCGAGMAGLVAAVTAAEQGADVLVIEKGVEIGGSARLSSGYIWTHADLDSATSLVPRANPMLQQLVVEGLADAMKWLESIGVHIGAERAVLDYGRGWQVDPNQALAVLESCLRGHNGRINLEQGCSRLLTERGGVVGIETTVGDAVQQLEADAVVLATGGFQGNSELLRRYCFIDSENVYHRANPWSTGDGLVAALEAGAATSPGMECFYGHAMLAPPARVGPDDFSEATQYQGMFAVALNLDGERFADETEGTGEEVLNQALARQRDGRAVYIVDSTSLDRPCLPPDLLLTRVVVNRALDRGAAVVADTLDELASLLTRFGVNSERAAQTLVDFNDRAASARALSPPRDRDIAPLDSPPFYAVHVKAAITFTMGGLAVTDEMEVVRRAASSSPLARLVTSVAEFRQVPIPGLFAAGCDVGDISHLGYMGGLATAITTGRIAGRAALRRRASM